MPFCATIPLLLTVVLSVFVSDCPPLPQLLNLGQITGVQLSYVIHPASQVFRNGLVFFPETFYLRSEVERS